MSKKKSFSGNTMTLKDFHGGSIPSDLPLPSAPGVIVRSNDRPGYDRQPAWGNPIGRSDHRLRPSSSGSIRNLDDKTPFLNNAVHIGRNFDEDERKPLDGVSAPRRTVSDDSIRGPSMRMDPKPDGGRFLGQQGVAPVGQTGTMNASSYSARVVEGGNRSWGGNGGQGVGGSYPNAWAARKEATAANETMSTPVAGESTVAKFAQASALDKVSSGRWQTKPVHHQVDIEVIRQSESPNRLNLRENDSYNGVNLVSEREYYEKTLATHAERSLTIENGIQGGPTELPWVERVHSPVLSDGKEKTSVTYMNEGRSTEPAGRYGAFEMWPAEEVSERPKLKLLPRTKPLDVPEHSPVDPEPGQLPAETSRLEVSSEMHGNATHTKPGSNSREAGNQLVERPKLNLKPRSQPLEQSEESIERERVMLFGGGRPRELVLKERDVAPNNHDQVQIHSRVKNDSPRTATVPARVNPPRYNERTENPPVDHRTSRINERTTQRADIERADIQSKNRRNQTRTSGRDAVKPQPQEKERHPSPETWRKPVEQPKPSHPDASGARYGKAVSAVDLALAFSKSVSDHKSSTEPFSGRQGPPGRTPVPFSRLIAPTTRPQINGF